MVKDIITTAVGGLIVLIVTYLIARLGGVVKKIINFYKRTEKMTEAIDDLSKKSERMAEAIDDLFKRSERMAEAIDDLSKRSERMAEAIDDLSKKSERMAEAIEGIDKGIKNIASSLEKQEKLWGEQIHLNGVLLLLSGDTAIKNSILTITSKMWNIYSGIPEITEPPEENI